MTISLSSEPQTLDVLLIKKKNYTMCFSPNHRHGFEQGAQKQQSNSEAYVYWYFADTVIQSHVQCRQYINKEHRKNLI